MQRIINQIYWNSADFYQFGTRLTMDHKERVHFHNELMAPGKTVVRWESSLNYQSHKTVPQLPILRVGEAYRLVAQITSIPQNTYLIRLAFRDLQGLLIKQIDIRTNTKTFVFPSGAVTYSLEIINSGFNDLNFDRIEIGPADLPEVANHNVWVHQPFNVSQKQPLNIFLVMDGKRARKTYPKLKNRVITLPIQVLSIAWQTEGELQDWMVKWLTEQQLQQFHLISTQPLLNTIVKQICTQFPQAEGLIAGGAMNFANCYSWHFSQPIWANSNIIDPNWQMILSAVKRLWEDDE